LKKVDDVRAFINVPLQAVQSLSMTAQIVFDSEPNRQYTLGSSLPGKQLWLPAQAAGVPPDQVPALVRQAAVNVAACPAWRASHPTPAVRLFTNDNARAAASFNDSTRIQLISAMEPVLAAGPVTHVQIHMPGFKIGAAEVAALGQVSGGHLTRLTIAAADLHSSFWLSVFAHLPKLDTLVLVESLALGPLAMADIAMFYCHAPRPITLRIAAGVVPSQQFQGLQECCQLWSTSQVTICRPASTEAWWG
jgi:hypothetical protein